MFYNSTNVIPNNNFLNYDNSENQTHEIYSNNSIMNYFKKLRS